MWKYNQLQNMQTKQNKHISVLLLFIMYIKIGVKEKVLQRAFELILDRIADIC